MSEEQIQVVRTESTLSLSERSTITYEIGSKGENQYIRLSGNSAGGLFCKDWVSMADIQPLLSGCPNVTSKTLSQLYAGRSSNSPGFLAACIINEKMAIGKDTEKKDCNPTPDIPPSKPAKVKKNTAKELPA